MIKIENITPRKNVIRYQNMPQLQQQKKENKSIILRVPNYLTQEENLIIVKDVDESEVKLNSNITDRIIIKSLTNVIVIPDLGQIDEEWDELLLEKGACVQFQFVEGNWYILSSDGLKIS